MLRAVVRHSADGIVTGSQDGLVLPEMGCFLPLEAMFCF